MKNYTKLKKAIALTIEDLVTGRKHYNWFQSGSCNCGILAQNIMGKSAHEILISKKHGIFSDLAKKCSVTGLPIDIVMGAMQDVGLSWVDIAELENLGNPKIAHRAGIELVENNNKSEIYTHFASGTRFDVKRNLIKYLTAWLEILNEDFPDVAAPEPKDEEPLHELPASKMKFLKVEEIPVEMFNN